MNSNNLVLFVNHELNKQGHEDLHPPHSQIRGRPLDPRDNFMTDSNIKYVVMGNAEVEYSSSIRYFNIRNLAKTKPPIYNQSQSCSSYVLRLLWRINEECHIITLAKGRYDFSYLTSAVMDSPPSLRAYRKSLIFTA